MRRVEIPRYLEGRGCRAFEPYTLSKAPIMGAVSWRPEGPLRRGEEGEERRGREDCAGAGLGAEP